MEKIFVLISLFLLVSCNQANKTTTVNITDNQIYESFEKNVSFVHNNFYVSSPYFELDPDNNNCDDNYACVSKKYHSIDEFKSFIINNYELSEVFVDKLIEKSFEVLYEKNNELYVISAARGFDITVGEMIKSEVIKENDERIILRNTYETINPETNKAVGSFDVDNILVLIDGKWVWDEIPKYH